jgi:hypothetical protein
MRLFAGLIAGMLALMGTAQANTYYALELESAKLTPKGLTEDGRPYDITVEGGGIRPKIIYDAAAGSKVLVLETSSTPSGASKDRAELRFYSGVTFNRTLFMGMRVKHQGSVDPGDWHLFMQCHQTGSQKSPPLSLNLLPGNKVALIARSYADSYERLWTGDMPPGRWRDLVIGFRMGAQGHVQLWLDGRKVADARLPLRWKGFEDRCVLKTGVYRAASDAPFQMRFDDIRLGDSYRDVAR